jgi:hypothetical protein
MTEKNTIQIDNQSENKYIPDKKKAETIQSIKTYAIMLSQVYGGNIKIEIDINPKIDSLKFRVTEFNL